MDGAINGEASKCHHVMYKQTENEFIAAKKRNSNSNKFQKKNHYSTYDYNVLLQIYETIFVIVYFFVSLSVRVGNLVFTPAINIQRSILNMHTGR